MSLGSLCGGGGLGGLEGMQGALSGVEQAMAGLPQYGLQGLDQAMAPLQASTTHTSSCPCAPSHRYRWMGGGAHPTIVHCTS